MIGKFALVAASGLLALSIGMANAQQQPQAGANNPNQDKCWDVASKTIKTKAAVTGTTSAAGSKPGTASTGSASGSASGGMQGSAAADADRPAAAKGLPVC